MAQIRFCKGRLIGYTPWHSGPDVHVVAAVEPPGTAKPPLAKQQSTIKKLAGAFGNASGAFEEYDTDASGTLSRAEFEAALRQKGVVAGIEEVDEIFSRLDTDGNSTLELREFETAFVAARLAGGVDVYVPVQKGGPMKLKQSDVPTRVAYLESEAFKQKLLYGWRGEKV